MSLAAVRPDPLCHWETRRYWTLRRWVWAGFLALAWWGAVLGCFLANQPASPTSGSAWAKNTLALAGCLLLLRVPLHFLTATGAALAVAPERLSGLLEQFQLTPVNPWRFCLARVVGRLRGVFWLWALSTVPVFLLVQSMINWDSAGERLALALAVLAVQLDAAVMVLASSAAGAHFTATAASTASALFRTYLAVLSYEPLTLTLALLGGGAVGQALYQLPGIGDDVCLVTGLIVLILVRLGLGALLVALHLRWALKGTERVFYEPEAAA